MNVLTTRFLISISLVADGCLKVNLQLPSVVLEERRERGFLARIRQLLG
jgi:hypothetical protein